MYPDVACLSVMGLQCLCCASHADKLPEAISHLINFVSLSGNPHEALAALQQSLPPTIFQILVQTMARLGEEVCCEAVNWRAASSGGWPCRGCGVRVCTVRGVVWRRAVVGACTVLLTV